MEYLRSLNADDSAIEVIGTSFEGRELKVLRIGTSASKEIIWIDGGHHAREWIGPTTAMYFAYQVCD